MMSGIQSSSAYSSMYASSQAPKGPKLDTNQDDSLDLQELESFSSKQAEMTGTSFDAQEVLTKYDSNEDGLISKAEGSTMREDNALNMPSAEEMQAQMMSRGGNRPEGMGPPPGGKGGGGGGAVEGSDDSLSIDALLEALETSDTEETTSTDDLTASLLEALEEGDSSYSASEIAQYDTNGDGSIDSIEEIAMNALLEEEEDDSASSFQAIVDKALQAYANQSNFDASTFMNSNDAFSSFSV